MLIAGWACSITYQDFLSQLLVFYKVILTTIRGYNCIFFFFLKDNGEVFPFPTWNPEKATECFMVWSLCSVKWCLFGQGLLQKQAC